MSEKTIMYKLINMSNKWNKTFENAFYFTPTHVW